MSKWSMILLALMMTAPTWARTGLVQTTDGQTLAGEIQFSAGTLVVSSAENQKTVPLSDIRHLKFDESMPDAAGDTTNATGLLGYYFSRTNVSGEVAVRLDPGIDFDWGYEEPMPGLRYDDFSVIWTGEVEAPETGAYTFFFEGDDGGRLFVANTLMGENWKRMETGEIIGTVTLQAGQRYPVMIFYFNNLGRARARLSWSGPAIAKALIPKERLHPKSVLTEHPAEVADGQGLLATYYAQADFRGHTYTCVVPTIDGLKTNATPAGQKSDPAAVRWSGQVQVDHSETYTFYLVTESAVRLWLNGRLLLEQEAGTGPTELKESLPLAGGQKYDLRLETRYAEGPKSVRLLWSSPSVSKGAIPATHLRPAQPPAPRQTNTEPTPVILPGVLLRNGNFLGQTVTKASDSAVELPSAWGGASSLSLLHVARIICQPLTERMVESIPSGRIGALLASGDFCEGELRGITQGQVELNSVIHGLCTFKPEEVVAVVLRDPAPAPGRYRLVLADKSHLSLDEVSFAENALVVREEVLGRRTIPPSAILRLEQTATTAATRVQMAHGPTEP